MADSEIIRIGIISDIHCGPDRETRVGSKAEEKVREFVVAMNEGFKPDLVVDLGDRVLDVDEATDIANQTKVRSAFGGLQCPVVHILGNHDRIHLSREQNEDIFQQAMQSRSFDLRGIHFVVLNTCDPVIGGVGGRVSDEQLEWLRSDLRNNPVKTVILCHHALGYQDVSTNVHFTSIVPWAYVDNKKMVWEVLKSHGQVIAVFNGHLHWNSMEVVSGTPCFSVNSLVETWTTGGQVSGSYAEATILESGSITFEVKGQDQRRFQYTAGADGNLRRG